ncbi:MAG: polymer-forming cytoskeletal protein [Anaerolineales bacterium]|nr:polymer-forming cytoskeletal protein [Anaerolineales bacterium]
MKILSRSKVWLLFTILLLFVAVPATSAAEIREGDRVVIASSEVIDDDLIIFSNHVEMNGTVKGDLITTASDIIINGTVEGSIAASGQSILVNGPVNGTVYAGGYLVTIGQDATIGRNVFAGGYQIKTEKGSEIGRSLYTGSQQTIVNGDVADDVVTESSTLVINGSVGGDVSGTVADPSGSVTAPPPFVPGMPAVTLEPPGYTTGPTADIGGEENIEIGTTPAPARTFTQQVTDVSLPRLGEFLALILVGALLIRFWPAFMQGTDTILGTRFFPSAGWGCLTMILFPLFVFIALGALFITALLVGGILTLGTLVTQIAALGGTALAFTVALFLVTFLTISKVVVTYFGGKRLMARFSKSENPNPYWAVVIGALIYEILAAIPIVGTVIAFIVILFGLGAIFTFIQRSGSHMIATKEYA